MNDVVVVYDIYTRDVDGERRLVRIAKVCERYGQRVQKSVFECRLDDARMERLVGELSVEIVPDLDSVFLYRLAGHASAYRRSLGRTTPHALGSPWVL